LEKRNAANFGWQAKRTGRKAFVRQMKYVGNTVVKAGSLMKYDNAKEFKPLYGIGFPANDIRGYERLAKRKTLC